MPTAGAAAPRPVAAPVYLPLDPEPPAVQPPPFPLFGADPEEREKPRPDAEPVREATPATDPAMPRWARQVPAYRSGPNLGRQLAVGFALLTLGVGAGCWLGASWQTPSGAESGTSSDAARIGQTAAVNAPREERLTPELATALDNAFIAMKGDQPGKAREQFAGLLARHPGWPSLAQEQARSAMYEHNGTASGLLIAEQEKAGRIPPADAALLDALLRMAANDFRSANNSFEHAANLDPTRADIFYFWGECLRRQGKPALAADRFRSAFYRNQYETAEGLYRLKIWLAEIQAGSDVASGAAAAIDAAAGAPHPSGYALVALAGRDLKSEKFTQAAEHLRRAAEVIDPPVFQLILQDPTFQQENWRPELAQFYPHSRPAPAPAAPLPSPSALPTSPSPPALSLPARG